MLKRSLVSLLTLVFALFIAAPVFAQSTSAALAGRVADPSGRGVAGAEVEILHQPSGTKATAVTDADGKFNLRGLRVGGPYAVKATAAGHEPVSVNDVTLSLNETASVNLVMTEQATSLQAVTVVSSAASTVFAPDNMGATTNISRAEIEAFPTVRRSLEDYVRFDPRVVQVDKERGGLAAAGQNNRYNNIKIDGVPTNDQFGLNDSGLPALNQPISIDWIQEFNIGVSNFDVAQTDFVGANINAVTKSGTNEFHGGVYGVYRNHDMVGDNENGVAFAGFDKEWTAGGYVGGPIIPDKLFFFAGYEKFERTAPGPASGLAGSGAANIVPITQAQVDQIQAIATNRYGLPDLGGNAISSNTDKKYFAKLDWNITDDQRATFRYNKTEGSQLRQNGFNNQYQLSSNFYEDNISFENFALLLYSRWSDAFSTEANVSYAEYKSLPTPFSDYPQIAVFVDSNNSVQFGQERSRQANQLENDTTTAFLAGNLALGDHTLKFGGDYEKNKVFNLFLQSAIGDYIFNSIADFDAGRWSRYRLQTPVSGDINSVAASFSTGDVGLFLQDTWSYNKNLTISYGFRVDTDIVDGTPKFNAAGLAAFGINNTNTTDGQRTVEPRIGFNYQFDTELRTQLRGGAGLFTGSAPGVWISNSFSNPGGLANAYDVRNGTGVSVDPDHPLIPAGAPSGSSLLNALSPDFQQPTVWRIDFAFERELPWWGMIAGLEWLNTQTEKGVVFSELNLGAPTGTLPDGRQEFWVNTLPASFANNRTPNNRPNKNPAFTNVIELSNTDAGNSRNITASLEKPFADDWYAKIAYTRGTGKEVSPGTSSVALSNWQNRTVFNPNEQVANTANYVFKDRVTAQLRKTWHFFTDSPTSAGLFYEGRSGRPYSYAFTGDANGDGQSFNDVFTVPNLATAQYSANSTAADIAAFQDYVTGNAYLNSHQGDVTRRNAVSAPFINYFDLNLTQKFPLVWKTQGEVYVNILNLGNLLNKHWGQIDEAAFPYSLGVARFAGVNNGQVVYDVSSFVNEGTGKVNNPALIRKDVAGESRWTVQVGFRIEF